MENTNTSALITKLLDPTGAAGEGTPYKFVHELPTKMIKLVPEENYRWGNAAAMKADLAHLDRDPEGGVINSYEVLKESIRAMGVNEPSGVVLRPDGFYHIVFGFTRIAAALEVGAAHIPARVYEPTLPDTEARLLQMMENSPGLRRPVNWVAEVKTFRHLSNSFKVSFESGKAPKSKTTGKPMSAKDAADEAVCRVLGTSVNTMRTRLSTFEKVPKRVRELAKEGKLTYPATQEFLPVKEKVGMTPEIVDAILDEMTRRDPELKGITPETVRQVYRWVMESRAIVKDPGSDEGEGETKEPTKLTPFMEQNLHNISPAVARDEAVEMMIACIGRNGLTATSPPESWEKVRRMETWAMVNGIGIGSSQVISPVIAGNSFAIHSHNYTIRVFLAAVLRCLVVPKGTDRQKFDEWQAGLTRVASGTQAMNRTEFARAVDHAVSETDHRTPLKTVLDHAVEELRSRLFR